jgi:hypothetical protein
MVIWFSNMLIHLEKPVVQRIQEDTVFAKVTTDAVFEEIEAPPLTETELAQAKRELVTKVDTKMFSDAKIDQILEKEFVKQVAVQPIVELHEQPRITEIHEQEIIEVQEQPIMRIIHENPIVKRYNDLPNEATTLLTSVTAETTIKKEVTTETAAPRKMRRAIYLVEVERPEI